MVKMPSLVLERMKKLPQDKTNSESFLIHSICFNCWIGINKNVDVWRPGEGFFTTEKDYFGKIKHTRTKLSFYNSALSKLTAVLARQSSMGRLLMFPSLVPRPGSAMILF